MKWIKKGLLYAPDTTFDWSKKYALYPTPYLLDEDTIRVFFCTLDNDFFGRIAYVDVDSRNPSIVKQIPENYVFDLGEMGRFDDCGVTPSCVMDIDGKTYMYYSGFCRSFKLPYYIFSGLALVNKDGSMTRVKEVPILDRTEGEYFDKAGQVVVYDNGVYKCWYVSGLRWETINSSIYTNKLMPIHVIRYGESKDGVTWETRPEICIDFANEEEFGFGRPWVIKENGIFKMWYSIRKRNTPYGLGYAESENGIDWIRMDDKANIETSDEGWDSEMICYASVIKVHDKTFMFHNGNNNGETGFGYAVLTEE